MNIGTVESRKVELEGELRKADAKLASLRDETDKMAAVRLQIIGAITVCNEFIDASSQRDVQIESDGTSRVSMEPASVGCDTTPCGCTEE